MNMGAERRGEARMMLVKQRLRLPELPTREDGIEVQVHLSLAVDYCDCCIHVGTGVRRFWSCSSLYSFLFYFVLCPLSTRSAWFNGAARFH